MKVPHISALAALALLAACAEPPEDADPAANEGAAVDLPQPSGPPVVQQAQPEGKGSPVASPAPGWKLASEGDGATLRLVGGDGGARLSIACLPGPPRLVANVADFTPVGSEDRFTLGLGTEPVTLVADPTDQPDRPGVTGEGPIPADIRALLGEARRISIVYGYQRFGPHDPPPADVAARFAAACDGLRP